MNNGRHYNNLRKKYLKGTIKQLDTKFMKSCIHNKVIPKCLQVRCSVSFGINYQPYLSTIENILNEASSRIVEQTIHYGEIFQEDLYHSFINECETVEQILNEREGKKLIDDVKRSCTRLVTATKNRHNRKLQQLSNYEGNHLAVGIVVSRSICGYSYRN